MRKNAEIFTIAILLKVLAGISCFFFLSLSYSQNPNCRARITVKRGNNVDFVFNSFLKYKNGITLTNFTTLEIYWKDTAVSPPNPIPPNYSTTWRLYANALTDKLYGDEAPHSLDLNYVELTANYPTYSTGKKALVYDNGGNGVALVTGAPQTDPNPVTITITYDVGTGVNKLLGKEPDYYAVDIVFTLTDE